MDTPPLVEADLQLGAMVRDVLAGDPELRIRAAFWWYDEDRQDWLFATSTPLYESKGAQAAYLRVRKVLAANGLLDRLPLDRVWIVDDRNPILEAVRLLARQFPSVWLLNVTVNGIVLPHVFIYKIERRRARPFKVAATGMTEGNTFAPESTAMRPKKAKTTKRAIRPKKIIAKRRTKA
jgi:hypothetical protein